jgi:hypothetical protein
MSERFGITPSHSEVESPMSTQFLPLLDQFSADEVLSDNLINLFQQMVGCLQHLVSQTRPDLKFSVNQLSRRAKCPTSRDYKAVRRLLFYVDQTKHMGLTFCSHGQPFELFVTADSSFNCYSDSKSHTGVTVHLGQFSGAVMSFCGKQSIIADSSTVAEFIGAHQACKIIAWVQNLLSEMDVHLTQPATLFQDNEATIRILHHKSNEARTKHIALRYNMIREFIQEGLIVVKHLSTDLMTADTLTKALSGPSFTRHQIRILNLSPPPASLLSM